MSACLFPVRGWKGKIVMSSEEYVSSITAAVAGSLCSQWLLMKSGGAWIRDGSEFLIMPPLVNWIFGGGGRRTGGGKECYRKPFLHSSLNMMSLHKTNYAPLIVCVKWDPAEKMRLPNKEAQKCEKPAPGGGGDGNYHTWYSPVCKTNDVIAARVRVKDQIGRLPRHRWPQVKTTSNKCVNATLRFVWALHRGRELIMLKSETDSWRSRPAICRISAEISCAHCVCKALLFCFFLMGFNLKNTKKKKMFKRADGNSFLPRENTDHDGSN